MPRCFFFDIDGTLTEPLTCSVPDSTREAIRLLQKQGNFVALATGRLQCDAIRIAHSLDIHDAVSDGGNGLTVEDEIIYHEGLDKEACMALERDIDGTRYPWAAATENAMIRYTRNGRYLEKVTERYYKTIIDSNFHMKDAEHIYKIYIAVKPEERENIPLHGLTNVWFKPDVMLIEPTHKERGIIEMQKRYQIPDDEIVVFGDGMNDCSMFRQEWMSIAMGNAKEALKKKAKYVTERADRDGIYLALKKFGWI